MPPSGRSVIFWTGRTRGPSPGDNGYADYNVSWTDWLADSGMKQFTTTAA